MFANILGKLSDDLVFFQVLIKIFEKLKHVLKQNLLLYFDSFI